MAVCAETYCALHFFFYISSEVCHVSCFSNENSHNEHRIAFCNQCMYTVCLSEVWICAQLSLQTFRSSQMPSTALLCICLMSARDRTSKCWRLWRFISLTNIQFSSGWICVRAPRYCSLSDSRCLSHRWMGFVSPRFILIYFNQTALSLIVCDKELSALSDAWAVCNLGPISLVTWHVSPITFQILQGL